ncbi:MAG: hypothetical protein LBE53_18175 [Paucimonas sp.]|jgi:alpha-1,6-mannosyltransferase|uniref:hypothetical protein n=1 Tax=Pantoea sp. Cy-639 TaxID=2608360 RepID=UPI0019661581|nr:hypothetical protein [Pantoea sp. Cy-639]MDR2309102.1 hypothetical protein [Paucimonas sp.]
MLIVHIADIEVGDPYLIAWGALEVRRKLDLPVIGFYHSDLPLLARPLLERWRRQAG